MCFSLKLHLISGFLVILKLASDFTTFIGEEFNFEIIDGILEQATSGGIEAIDQVFLEIADHAWAWITVFMTDAVDQRIDLGPRLSLGVLGH